MADGSEHNWGKVTELSLFLENSFFVKLVFLW